jgi:predicted peptidase
MRERQIKRRSSKWYNYLLYLPPDYQKKKYPLLLFLHGAGEKGNNLDKLKRHGPPKLIEEGKDLPFIVVSPQCPQLTYWHPDPLHNLVEEVAEETGADKNHIYITGISMGGYGTWAYCISYPFTVAAAVPICGGGDPRFAERMSSVPVWAFHGAQDDVVPPGESERMVNALREAGGQVAFTVYPEAGHDSWTQTYENPEVFEWLLQHE